MANPEIVECVQDEWSLVAEDITAVRIDIKSSAAKYFITWVDQGSPGPSDLTYAVPIRGTSFSFTSGDALDVYIYAVGADGSVQVGEGITMA